jgi:hypothetical protein
MFSDQTMHIPDTGSPNDASHDSSPKVMLSCVEEEFYTVGRIQTTSHKKQNLSHVSSSLLFPNPVLKAYTGAFPTHTHFQFYKQYPDDPMPPSDLSSIRHLYNVAPEEFVIFDEKTSQKKDKPQGITRIFKWLGWVCRTIFVDINEDGDIDAYGLSFVTTD